MRAVLNILTRATIPGKHMSSGDVSLPALLPARSGCLL